MELGLSNRDLSGGDSPEYKNASRMILDAYVEYNFYKGFFYFSWTDKTSWKQRKSYFVSQHAVC